MKQILPFFFLFLSTAHFLNAQITVTNSTFPAPGDTLITAVDNLPSGINITAPGPSQSWDFTSLQAPFNRELHIRAANQGNAFSSFPQAEIVTEFEVNAEGYYNITDNTYEFLGYVGPDPADIGLDLTVNMQPVLVERRAPMNYFDITQTESAALIAFSADDIPGGFLDSLPITPDSLRIRFASDRFDVVDAWGTLTIPGGIYDVLREKRTEIRDVRLDIRIGFLPWQDVTDLLPGSEFFGRDTVTTYHFFNDEEKEPIAVVTVDDEENPTRVEFKANDVVSHVQNVSSLRPGVYAYPNPAIVNVRFEFTNLDPGLYTLKIFNILGLEVWKNQYRIYGNRTEKVNLLSLKKGTYLYSLIDEKGKTLSTRRLMVVRP